MKLFFLVIAAAVLLGLLLRGRVSRLESLRPHWWGLVLIGLGLQFVPLPQGTSGKDLMLRTTVLAISYGLLLAFAAANLGIKGVPLILAGLTMNAVVIVANGGTPVSADALRSSGQVEVLAWLETQ